MRGAGLLPGTVRRLGPGDILIAKDLTGQGHATREVGPEPRVSIFVPSRADLLGPRRAGRAGSGLTGAAGGRSCRELYTLATPAADGEPHQDVTRRRDPP